MLITKSLVRQLGVLYVDLFDEGEPGQPIDLEITKEIKVMVLTKCCIIDESVPLGGMASRCWREEFHCVLPTDSLLVEHSRYLRGVYIMELVRVNEVCTSVFNSRGELESLVEAGK